MKNMLVARFQRLVLKNFRINLNTLMRIVARTLEGGRTVTFFPNNNTFEKAHLIVSVRNGS
jgi:hypothetical protein